MKSVTVLGMALFSRQRDVNARATFGINKWWQWQLQCQLQCQSLAIQICDCLISGWRVPTSLQIFSKPSFQFSCICAAFSKTGLFQTVFIVQLRLISKVHQAAWDALKNYLGLSAGKYYSWIRLSSNYTWYYKNCHNGSSLLPWRSQKTTSNFTLFANECHLQKASIWKSSL